MLVRSSSTAPFASDSVTDDRILMMSQVYLYIRSDPPKMRQQRQVVIDRNVLSGSNFRLSVGMIRTFLKEYRVYVQFLPERDGWYLCIDRLDNPAITQEED